MPSGIITLTTDFGLGSPYVAQMKGVILSLCPGVQIVDVTHAVKPQNIREGAIVLADVAPRFPPGTIHLAVIDPGVGSARRIVYAEIGQQRFVAPDNGLLSLLASRETPSSIITIENPEHWLPRPSHTFHGRDIMAPVAARLALGLAPEELGPIQSALIGLEWPTVRRSTSEVAGQILYVDSFGNLITNISRQDLASLGKIATLAVNCGGLLIRGLVPSYAAAMPGEVVALFDSQDRLEIACVNGNAATKLSLHFGEAVTVTLP